MGRAPCCDKANVKKGPWSPEEDAKLRSYIEKHGTGGNWIALPPKIGLKRCGKSCRLRWLNYLRPDIKHGGFSEEEDDIIRSLYISIGSRWSAIAAQLPGRTDNDVKNYWNTRLKKKLLRDDRNDNGRRLAGSTKPESKDGETARAPKAAATDTHRQAPRSWPPGSFLDADHPLAVAAAGHPSDGQFPVDGAGGLKSSAVDMAGGFPNKLFQAPPPFMLFRQVGAQASQNSPISPPAPPGFAPRWSSPLDGGCAVQASDGNCSVSSELEEILHRNMTAGGSTATWSSSESLSSWLETSPPASPSLILDYERMRPSSEQQPLFVEQMHSEVL